MNTLVSLTSPKFLSIPSFPNPPNKPTFGVVASKPSRTDTGIPYEQVTTLSKFKSRHNFIQVIQISRQADHPFRGGRLLLLDSPGNISSITFLHRTLTDTYFDVFATLPPLLPPGPTSLLGFGAGSTTSILLRLYPHIVLHCWELDPAVVDVARVYFNVSRLEHDYKDRLLIHIGDGLKAHLSGGFAGLIVDLFSQGSLVRELEETSTWETLKSRLRKGGRVMVNVGGRCVEAEDSSRDGKAVMESCLKAMYEVFRDDGLHLLRLGNGEEDDSTIALTGGLPDLDSWRMAMPKSLRGFVHMWTPYEP